MEYTVIFHKATEGGYWVEVPALPGCYSQGETVDEATENIKEAIEAHLAVLREEKMEMPVDKDIFIGRVGVTQLAGTKI